MNEEMKTTGPSPPSDQVTSSGGFGKCDLSRFHCNSSGEFHLVCKCSPVLLTFQDFTRTSNPPHTLNPAYPQDLRSLSAVALVLFRQSQKILGPRDKKFGVSANTFSVKLYKTSEVCFFSPTCPQRCCLNHSRKSLRLQHKNKYKKVYIYEKALWVSAFPESLERGRSSVRSVSGTQCPQEAAPSHCLLWICVVVHRTQNVRTLKACRDRLRAVAAQCMVGVTDIHICRIPDNTLLATLPDLR